MYVEVEVLRKLAARLQQSWPRRAWSAGWRRSRPVGCDQGALLWPASRRWRLFSLCLLAKVVQCGTDAIFAYSRHFPAKRCAVRDVSTIKTNWKTCSARRRFSQTDRCSAAWTVVLFLRPSSRRWTRSQEPQLPGRRCSSASVTRCNRVRYVCETRWWRTFLVQAWRNM